MRTVWHAFVWLSCCAAAFGQGTLQVGNTFGTGATGFRAPIYGVDPDCTSPGNCPLGSVVCGPPSSFPSSFNGPLLQGTGFTFALFAGPVGVSDPNALQLVVTTTFRTSSGGGLPAGLITTVTVPINGVAPGEIAALQVRAWDNRGGTLTSWAQVLADPSTPWGTYGVFYSQPLGGQAGGTIITPPEMRGWTSFNIAPGGNICNVPEPSWLAFAGLAAVSLLVHKRTKRELTKAAGQPRSTANHRFHESIAPRT